MIRLPVFLTDVSNVADGVEKELGVFQKYLQQMPEQMLALSVRVVLALLVFLIGGRLIGVLMKIIRRTLQKVNISLEASRFLESAVKGGLYALLILQIALQLGVEAASIATLIGSVGVTVGLAIQGSLSNCIGGLLILMLKPFKIGDYIIEDTAKNEGTVQEISLFYTRLATTDNRIVLIPNGTLANSSITNVTDEAFRRMNLLIGISYQADIRQARAVILNLLQKDSRICQDKDQLVFVDSLGDSAVMLGVRYWTGKEDYWTVKWDLLEEIKTAFDEEGIGIPYQQLDVHLVAEK